MISVQPIALDFFVSRLERRNPFAFVRYGDGEWNCIHHAPGENCDHSTYFPDLGEALAETLRKPHTGNYLYAMGPKAAQSPLIGKSVQRWLDENAPDIIWNDSEVFLRTSLAGALYPLVRILRLRRVVLVGGAHLQALAELDPLVHVIVPDVNAWLDKERIAKDILRASFSTNPLKRAEVILFCAGMTSKVLMWELYPLMHQERVTMLDMGSVFDMYCGVDSRKYARQMPAHQKEALWRLNFISPELAAQTAGRDRAES